MGRSRRAARANASRLHGCQLTGCFAARARYGVADCAIRLVRGPCSETHASARSSRGGARRSNPTVLMSAGGRYPVHRTPVPKTNDVRVETDWDDSAGPLELRSSDLHGTDPQHTRH